MSKEEYEEGAIPESYSIVVKAKDETSFQFITNEIRSALKIKNLFDEEK